MMQKKSGFLPLLFSAAALLLAACTPASAHPSDLAERPLRVVATTGMIADLVKNVGGERVQVTGLMGAGIDPHLYKASAGDVRLIANSDAIFYNGLHLEAGMAKVFERLADTRIQTVAVTDLIDREVLLAPPEFQGAYDPHIWFDVTLWMRAVEAVRQGLSELDPGSAAMYEQNAAAYLEELSQLDEYITSQANLLPADKRVIITAHDAFNYFGRAYGFEVRGLQGISTATEAGTGDVSGLADFIAEREIPAVFIETSVPLRNIEAVQAAVQDRGFDLSIGGELFSDAMGNPGTPEGSYIGMVRHNIDTIVTALRGQ